MWLVPAYAQRDFAQGSIVLTSGETLTGWIDRGKTNKNYKRCTFKADKKGPSRDYTPAELRSYRFNDGKRYVAFTGAADSSNYFAEQMLEGKASLYTNGEYFLYSKDGRFGILPEPYNKIVAKKDARDQTRYSIRVKPHVDTLFKVMSDCQEMAQPIRYASYSQRSFTALFKKYNACVGSPTKEFDNQPWVQVRFKLGAGLAFTKFTLTPGSLPLFRQPTVDKSQATTFGGGITLLSPRINPQLQLVLEGWYVKNSFHGRSMSQSSVNTYYYEFFADVTSYKIPFGFQYQLSNGPLSPFVGVGFMDEIITKTSSSASLDIATGNLVTVSRDPDITGFRKNMAGFWVSAGITQRISGRLAAILMARYERMNGYIGMGVNTDSKVDAVSAVFQLQF